MEKTNLLYELVANREHLGGYMAIKNLPTGFEKLFPFSSRVAIFG